MEVRVLASSPGSEDNRQYASSYLINGRVAIDSGPLGLYGMPDDQGAIRHVFITHSHADHIATLPIFVENAFDLSTPAVVVHGSPAVIHALRTMVFNDIVWPDFIRLSRPERPFLILHEIQEEQPVEVEGLRILPVEVNHNLPTFGYIVTDGRSTVIFGADSAPTDRIWELAHSTPAPRSVFLEASFPESMTWLAKASSHMTPRMFGGEYKKMPPMDRVLAIHVKLRWREEIHDELRALNIPVLEFAESGKLYSL